MRYCIYDNSGRILKFGMAPDDLLPILEQQGNVLDLGSATCDDATQYVQNGQLMDMPPRPSVNHVFDYDAKAWVDPRSLDQLKAAKWDEIKAAREAAEYGGFTWDGSTFDSDAASQQKIIGASQMANLTPGFEIDWTLADNTVRTLNATEMNSVGIALGQHVNAQYVHARNLRQQIEAATSAQEVQAIVW